MGHIQGMPPKISLFFFRSMMCSLEELRSEMKLSLQERGGEFTLEKKGDEHKTSGENRLFLTVLLIVSKTNLVNLPVWVGGPALLCNDLLCLSFLE